MSLRPARHLLSHPEGHRRNPGSARGRPGLVAVCLLLLHPPGQFVLTIAHDDDRLLAPAILEGLSGAITVATLVDHAHDLGQRGKHGRDGLLRRRLVPVALDRIRDLELRILLQAIERTVVEVIVDRGAGDTADLEQVAALRQLGREIVHRSWRRGPCSRPGYGRRKAR